MPKDLMQARGSGAIPMTPFDEKDCIDIPVLEKEIDFLVRANVGCICTPVMVSEFMALSTEERKLMIRIPVEIAAGRTAVIANCAACDTKTAVDYAQYAQKLGADALIAMAPWAGSGDMGGIKAYFKAIARATDLPIMIQNAGIPGVQMSPSQMLSLMDEAPTICWVKEEVPPGPASISALMHSRTDALRGIMSGFSGRFAPMDFKRGAIATIHACEFCDVVQKVWDLLFEGREKEARDLHYALLPALELETLFGMAYAKEIMVRRGLFTNTRMRNRTQGLTSDDLYEIDKVWERTQPLLLL